LVATRGITKPVENQPFEFGPYVVRTLEYGPELKELSEVKQGRVERVARIEALRKELLYLNAYLKSQKEQEDCTHNTRILNRLIKEERNRLRLTNCPEHPELKKIFLSLPVYIPPDTPEAHKKELSLVMEMARLDATRREWLAYSCYIEDCCSRSSNSFVQLKDPNLSNLPDAISNTRSRIAKLQKSFSKQNCQVLEELSKKIFVISPFFSSTPSVEPDDYY